jgi:Family of unknown function (DUF6788)
MKRPAKWKDLTQVKGAEAARARQRKYALIERFQIPDGLLPGTICISYRKCGNPNCRCSSGEGHESWSWTFMLDGKKRVEHVPADKLEEIRSRIEQGREFQDAVREVLAANARLIVLERQQLRARMKKR